MCAHLKISLLRRRSCSPIESTRGIAPGAAGDSRATATARDCGGGTDDAEDVGGPAHGRGPRHWRATFPYGRDGEGTRGPRAARPPPREHAQRFLTVHDLAGHFILGDNQVLGDGLFGLLLVRHVCDTL